MASIRLDPHKLKELRQLEPWRFMSALAAEYIVIALLLFVSAATLNGPAWLWLSWPILWALIASRQHGVLILMHDTAHQLAFRQRWLNDFFGEVVCAGPMFISMLSYRRDHLAHHKWMNLEKDPDWERKIGDETERENWLFPVQKTDLRYWATLWFRSITLQMKALMKNSSSSGKSAANDKIARNVLRIRLASYVLLAACLTFFGLWVEFILFWLIPALFFLPFIMRIRSLAEHFALEYENEFSEARNVFFSSPLEKYFFAPHNVALHLDHHLFAAVPFYRLPALNAALSEDSRYRAFASANDGYFWGKETFHKDMKNKRPGRPLWNIDAAASQADSDPQGNRAAV